MQHHLPLFISNAREGAVVQAAVQDGGIGDAVATGVLSKATLLIPAGYKAQLVLYSVAALLIWASIIGVLMCARRPTLRRGRSVPSTPRRPLLVTAV